MSRFLKCSDRIYIINYFERLDFSFISFLKERFLDTLKEVLQLEAVIEKTREYTLEQICSGNMDEQDGDIEKQIRFDEETEV